MGEDPAAEPAPFSGPGERLRRDARLEWIQVVEGLALLRKKGGRPEHEWDTIKQGIQVRLAKLAMLNQIADAEESAAAAGAMSKSSDALVKWTKVMVWVVAVQALAAIATVIVMVAG